MESRFRVLFLIVAMVGLPGCAATKNLLGFGDREAPPPSAEPVGQVIDLSYGLRVAYHLTEGFFVEGTAGYSEAGLTSFEVLSGGARLISDSEREFVYYNLNLGYNILPGEVFLGEGRAYNTNLYLIAGLGSTSFAGDDRFTVNFGAGYRFLLTDSVALHLDFRDHLFDIDLLGEEKTAHNLEAHLGVTVFF